jgi:hypothetical protein
MPPGQHDNAPGRWGAWDLRPYRDGRPHDPLAWAQSRASLEDIVNDVSGMLHCPLLSNLVRKLHREGQGSHRGRPWPEGELNPVHCPMFMAGPTHLVGRLEMRMNDKRV